MNLFSVLLNNLLLVEIQVDKNKTSMIPVIVKYNKKRIKYEIKEDLTGFLRKKKNSLVILEIFGDQVMTKTFNKTSFDSKKITDNQNLIWEKQAENEKEITLSFLRKECIQALIGELERNNMLILDRWISTGKETDRERKINAVYNEKLSFRAISRSKMQLNQLFEFFFLKIRLPVLVFLFVLLLSNFFYFEHLRKENEIKQLTYNTRVQNLKLQNENQEKINRLAEKYNTSKDDRSFALLADRIASYIPRNIRLYMLSINPVEGSIPANKELKIRHGMIVIKGEADVPGAVILLSQQLKEDKLFAQVKINAIKQKKGSDQFDFELQIIL